MKASENNFLNFLRKTTQFIIPIYQRTYSWNLEQCKQLWDDVNEAGGNSNISSHFIGSVVYIEQDTYQISAHNAMLVIDGQQRLTTLVLLLEAFARELSIRQKEIDNMSADKLRNRYLLNPSEDNEQEFKLLLTETDKDSLLALLKQKDLPSQYSIKIKDNFNYFCDEIKKCNDEKMQKVWNGINKIIVVDVSLMRGKDNPQLIFESMNSTGKALSQVDLIRNFILMELEEKQQRELYTDYWRKMELAFGQEQNELNAFVRHYLIMKTKAIPKIDDVYEAYKKYKKGSNESVNDLVKDLYNYSTYFCDMFFGEKTEYTTEKLSKTFESFRKLNSEVAYPMLLELYRDFSIGILKEDELYEIVKLIESYIFRRSICEIPTNSLNKTFATFISKEIDKNDYLNSVKKKFINLDGYKRFPNDHEFQSSIRQRDVYKLNYARYLLISLENYRRAKGKININEEYYTIEHIMPQTLSEEWKSELGHDSENIHTELLHTLGNLTLTEYNIEYSNELFEKKLNLPEKGLKYSPLMLNSYFRNPKINKWDREHIEERAQQLAENAIDIWTYPKILDIEK